MILCAKCNKNPARIHQIYGATWCQECSVPTKFYVKGKKVGDIEYFDGKRRTITKSMLKEIKSGVQTHEGEYLYGRSAQKYMDTYSRKYLGKDLSGSYKDERI